MSSKTGSDSRVAFWDARRGTIRTRKGGWIIGKDVRIHGRSLLNELVHSTSYFQLLVLDVTGRLPDKALAAWLEAAFMCLSWPDPRIWCNQIGTFGGALRAGPVASAVAGVLASDSRMYGPGTALDVAEFFSRMRALETQGTGIGDSISRVCRRAGGRPLVPGYGRPVARGDERVVALKRVAQRLEFKEGDYVRLAWQIDEYADLSYGISINLAGYMVAFLLDRGFSGHEIYRLCSICVNAGVQACYAEAFDGPPDAFLPLRCDDIEYTGKAPRPVPGS